MAINGLGTQPPPNSPGYGAQTNSSTNAAASVQEQKPPADSPATLELSAAGRGKAARQRSDAAYLAPGYNIHQDDAHNLLKRTGTVISSQAAPAASATPTAPVASAALAASTAPAIPAEPTGGIQVFGNRTGYNPRFQEGHFAKADELPEALTHGDLKYLVQYRQDQYKAAYLKANEDKVEVKKALAFGSEGVKKAYAELNDALTKEDLDYLVQYRREQYHAAVTRERELRPYAMPDYEQRRYHAAARKSELMREQRLSEASELPEALTKADVEYLLQYRRDQYEATFLKANEDRLNIKKALAFSSEGVKKAYGELDDVLVKEDLDFLLQYREEQYNATRRRAIDMMGESLAGPSGQTVKEKMQELREQFAQFSGN